MELKYWIRRCLLVFWGDLKTPKGHFEINIWLVSDQLSCSCRTVNKQSFKHNVYILHLNSHLTLENHFLSLNLWLWVLSIVWPHLFKVVVFKFWESKKCSPHCVAFKSQRLSNMFLNHIWTWIFQKKIVPLCCWLEIFNTLGPDILKWEHRILSHYACMYLLSESLDRVLMSLLNLQNDRIVLLVVQIPQTMVGCFSSIILWGPAIISQPKSPGPPETPREFHRWKSLTHWGQKHFEVAFEFWELKKKVLNII